jgi:hypothetical protein
MFDLATFVAACDVCESQETEDPPHFPGPPSTIRVFQEPAVSHVVVIRAAAVVADASYVGSALLLAV